MNIGSDYIFILTYTYISTVNFIYSFIFFLSNLNSESFFAIESIQFRNGYATWYLSWNTYIYNYSIDGQIHRKAHKIPNYSPVLSLWEVIRNFKLYHLCMISAKFNLIQSL
jgi:hypothetical protein